MIPCIEGVHLDGCYLDVARPALDAWEDSVWWDPITNVTVHSVEEGSTDFPGGWDDSVVYSAWVAGELECCPEEDVSCTSWSHWPVVWPGPVTDLVIGVVVWVSGLYSDRALVECT